MRKKDTVIAWEWRRECGCVRGSSVRDMWLMRWAWSFSVRSTVVGVRTGDVLGMGYYWIREESVDARTCSWELQERDCALRLCIQTNKKRTMMRWDLERCDHTQILKNKNLLVRIPANRNSPTSLAGRKRRHQIWREAGWSDRLMVGFAFHNPQGSTANYYSNLIFIVYFIKWSWI